MKVILGEKFRDSLQNIRGLIYRAIVSDKNILQRSFARAKAKWIIDKIIINNSIVDIDKLVGFVNSLATKKDGSSLSTRHRALLMKALYSTILKRLREGHISTDFIAKLVSDRVDSRFFSQIKKAKAEFRKKYKRNPPGTMLLSPTKKCNLVCRGCYSNSSPRNEESLDFETAKKIIMDAHSSWGIRSLGISGGEPFIYKSRGKGIIDLANEFPHLFFQIYTNGTLITQEVAQKIAQAANITPTISIEGFSSDTDWRRGQGTHELTLRAIQNLKEAGVPFGVSITATCDNIETLLREDFYDYLFEDLKITYGWIFEYMPIGRGADVDMMPTPKQRKELFWVLDKQNKNGRFICDFWSTSPASEGCIGAGRTGAYLHVNYNGNISPCAFNPFSDTNLLEVYSEGGNIASAVENSRLLKRMRQWQKDYGYGKKETGNLMMPCPIRDHFADYLEIIKKTGARYVADDIFVDINDQLLVEKMKKYNTELKKELDPVWKERFLKEELTLR